ncbi:MAG: extracellular solute-binding protein [Rubritepida sp.]|jgi:iron(III) transport system substrate-binding protein|nr:extracellular solute-binding protein [Rubritepida sp.]MCU0944818.1 extracellular solute-binding protein [Rubritepida sp.]
MAKPNHLIARRGLLAGAAGLAAVPALAQTTPAPNPAMEELARAAARESGPCVWYESSPQEQTDRVIAAFNRRYPNVRMQHVRLVGGVDIAARMVQEARTPGQSADIASVSADQIWGLNGRNLLAQVDWARLGASRAQAPVPFTVNIAAAAYVIVYNRNLVPADAVPTNWDSLLDPRWQGRTGTWLISHPFAQLTKAWDEARATAFTERYARMNPMLFRSTFTLAQQIAAGELPIGLGLWHAAQPVIARGAPVATVALEPTVTTSIWTAVARNAPNPNSARLFVAWLLTPEGATAYEEATQRGSALVPGTRTAEMLRGKTVVEYGPEETEVFRRHLTRFNEMLKAGGREAG